MRRWPAEVQRTCIRAWQFLCVCDPIVERRLVISVLAIPAVIGGERSRDDAVAAALADASSCTLACHWWRRRDRGQDSSGTRAIVCYRATGTVRAGSSLYLCSLAVVTFSFSPSSRRAANVASTERLLKVFQKYVPGLSCQLHLQLISPPIPSLS